MVRTSINIRFACLHPVASLGRDADMSSVQCPVCGERRVSYVAAPSPKFVGTAEGPHVTTTELEPIKVSFGE